MKSIVIYSCLLSSIKYLSRRDSCRAFANLKFKFLCTLRLLVGVKCVISILLLCCFPALAKDNAQKLYESGQYDEAINKYNRILTEHPDWEEAHFGKGSALYKSEKTDEAMREFELAISSKDPLQKSAVYYNMGNALIKSERLEESLKFYKRALELNPKDYDAKHNFELVRQMMQQQNQSQQQQDQNDKKDQQNQQNQQKDDQQDKKEKQEQQKQQSQSQQTPQKQLQERQKSQEEAAQVLDALKDGEKKMMQERMKTKYSGIKKEKDW